uniref:Uncharacterized protein n=1 Tax=Amphora coffeiformis TaxID=265554 RepID=A0A7S3P1A1_9STRA
MCQSPSTSSSSRPPPPPSEEEAAGFLSRLTFRWMKDLFGKASALKKNHHTTALELDDLLRLPAFDYGHVIYQDFQDAWQETEPSPKEAVDDATKQQGRGGEREPPTTYVTDLNESRDVDRIQHAALHVMGRRFYVAGMIKVFNTGLQFSFPLLLQAILQFIEDSQMGRIAPDAAWHQEYKGYWLAGCLFAAMAAKALTENAYFQRVYRAGYQTRVAVSLGVYHKALRLANAARQSTTLGELVNLMQVDATKMEMMVPQAHVLWDGLLQITGYMVILYTLIGWPCLAGLVVMIMAGPVQGVIMGKLFGLNRQMVQYTDGRVKTTNEALQGMQSVKMFAWEDNFCASIGANRNQELGFLKRIAYLRGFSRAYMSALPGLVAVASFVVLAVTDTAEIKASTLFAALVAFDQLRFPLLFYPVSLAQLAQAKVSAARVQTFLQLPEVGHADGGDVTYYRQEDAAEGRIVVDRATVYWNDPDVPLDETQHSAKSSMSKSSSKKQQEKDTNSQTDGEESTAEFRYAKPILIKTTLTVEPGQLCAVVGRVASGKSTLCSAILNETVLEHGSITLQGRVAYAAQSAWILNATVRDNILFGRPYDEERYHKVLQVCQLEHDLEMLEAGDLTEIGEKGVNLSGGQKQRVSIARAAYADADTIILDDPLSALDPEVASKLFHECVCEFMKGKTRLLVTNQLQFLQYCDNIVALGGGQVVEQGSYDELMAAEQSEVKRMLQETGRMGRDKATDKKSSENDAEPEKKARGAKKEKDTLVTQEERMIGAVSWSVYKKYFKAGGGFLKFAVIFFCYCLSIGNGLASTSWISYWTSDGQYTRHSQAFYLGIFFGLSVTLGIVTFARSFLLARFGVSASESLHRNLLDSILRAPSSFFDTTPLGRILSRFSKDLYSIDIELAEQMDFFLFCALQVIVSLSAILFVTPWFGVAVLPLGVIYITVLNYFREVSRETKRIDSISRSPVYAWFSETLSGLTTIRAYNQNKRFVDDFETQVDRNTRAYYNNKNADRWLSLRLETIGACVAGSAAAFASSVAISGAVSGQESDSNFSSLAGLSLTLAISLTGLLNFCVRSFAQLEAAMNACERVLYYTENILHEAPWSCDELEKKVASSHGTLPSPDDDPSAFAAAIHDGKAEKIADEWPHKGQIVLNNLKMRYRSDTPLVLKGLNVEIQGGERIGVVGRTGSGKSSLLLTLLRLVEPNLGEVTEKDYQSPIMVDGVDVLRVGLRDLRSRLGIIPQNPVLFSGTIRDNIDPFHKYTDEQIWQALKQCNLYDAVMEMPGELDAPVSEYGENLSAGTKQMLVLGRALLRQCRILLLDEATSNVDYETDKAIQKTLREAFPGCTILTIAHRIDTILDSDKILVMKDGVVDEFAPPQEFLRDESSTFSEIVRHSKNSGKDDELTL